MAGNVEPVSQAADGGSAHPFVESKRHRADREREMSGHHPGPTNSFSTPKMGHRNPGPTASQRGVEPNTNRKAGKTPLQVPPTSADKLEKK